MADANFVVGPEDLGRIMGAVQSAGGPIGAAAWLAGLGTTEQRAGVPTWAWITAAGGVALVAGIAVGVRYSDQLGKML